MSLHPCPRCQRHVRNDEALCPFCAEPLTPRPAVTKQRIAGRLTRAAIAAGAGLVVTSCSGGAKKESTPPPPRTADAGPETSGDAAPDPIEDQFDRTRDDLYPDKPYGAPPNRVRRA